MAYDFHYTPTGTGVISGKEVLEQTEDAINDLGNTAISGVQEALDKAEQALTNSENAVDDAQTALNTANNAEGVAIQAQTDVGNLSGTVTNIGNRVTTAEGNISNLQGRMTTAEGNITNLQGRMTTAETNIGNLQTAVSTAQATANSAQQTATTARQQSYVFRYSSTALVASSTNSNTLLDNTDNLKVGDKVIDSNGVLFSITAIDTVNSTFTIGTALIDLAQDSNVVHKSETENITGKKTFLGVSVNFKSSVGVYGSTSGNASINMYDKNSMLVSYLRQGLYNNGLPYIKIALQGIDENNQTFEKSLAYSWLGNVNQAYFRSETDNFVYLGTENNKWKGVYATNYYYGSNNVEFSTKFVTTDTTQVISGNKTFSGNVSIYNSDTSVDTKYLILKNQKVKRGSTTEIGTQFITFHDKDSGTLASYETSVLDSGNTQEYINVSNVDANSQRVVGGVKIIKTPTETWFTPDADNTVSSGLSNYKWKDVQTKLINGLTPSSLSLPDFANRVDITSYISNLTGATNNYIPSVNGWIYVGSNDASYLALFDTGSGGCGIRFSDGVVGEKYACIPCQAGRALGVKITCTNLAHAYFVPCLGSI